MIKRVFASSLTDLMYVVLEFGTGQYLMLVSSWLPTLPLRSMSDQALARSFSLIVMVCNDTFVAQKEFSNSER